MSDGSRTLAEWAAARIDLTPETARTLTQTARRLVDQPDLATELRGRDGHVRSGSRRIPAGRHRRQPRCGGPVPGLGYGRVYGGSPPATNGSPATTNNTIYRDRFLSIQPTLDQTSYKLWGQLPGIDGRTSSNKRYPTRADQFPALPDQKQCSRTQRNADAFVSIAHDSLNGNQTDRNHVGTDRVDLRRRPPRRCDQRGNRSRDSRRTPGWAVHPRTDPLPRLKSKS